MENYEELARGRYLRFLRRGRWEYVERINCTGIVVIVAVTEQGELVCVEQERPAVGCRVVDLPAGLAGDQGDEPLEAAAVRELMEETGFAADSMERLCEATPSPGVTSEIVTFFRARGIYRVAAGGGDESEKIRVHLVPLAGVRAWLEGIEAEGVLVDLKLYSGLYLTTWNGPAKKPSR